MFETSELIPVHFFQIQIDCYRGKRLSEKHRLPDLSLLTQISHQDSSQFADLFMGWHIDGIRLRVEVKGAFHSPDLPIFKKQTPLSYFSIHVI